MTVGSSPLALHVYYFTSPVEHPKLGKPRFCIRDSVLRSYWAREDWSVTRAFSNVEQSRYTDSGNLSDVAVLLSDEGQESGKRQHVSQQPV